MDTTLDNAIRHICSSLQKTLAIYVFGSFGTEYETAQSDLDLAILSEEPLDGVEIWRLSQNIASDLSRDVEIVDLAKASTVFRFQVITSGKRIFCSNESKCDTIENTYMSMYLKLNEERAEIIKDRQNG